MKPNKHKVTQGHVWGKGKPPSRPARQAAGRKAAVRRPSQVKYVDPRGYDVQA